MIYIFLAEGFEEIEALATLDVLRRAELHVKTVGIGYKTITGAHGITVHCDLDDTCPFPEQLDMIVLPGGMPGTVNLEQSKVVQQYIDYAVKMNLWIAAICAAPSILGHKALLEGKQVTCFPGYESQLGGAVYTGERVQQDGRLITAKGAGAAIPFALKLVECLLDKEQADILEASLQ